MVFRKSYDKKGFAVISFNREMHPESLREYMMKIKNALEKKCEEELKKVIGLLLDR
jgi:predicted fused transcriptional regulator/phosphomethylpyrimidine kinase